jgi:kumamolisin
VSEQRIAIAGSSPKIESGGKWTSVDPQLDVSATILIRRREQAGDIEEQLFSGHFEPPSREQAAQAIGADPRDLDALQAFIKQHGLYIVDENEAARTVKVEGAVRDMETAFGVKIGSYEDTAGRRFLSYQGEISVPQSLAGIVMAVLGLDGRPIARHHHTSG